MVDLLWKSQLLTVYIIHYYTDYTVYYLGGFEPVLQLPGEFSLRDAGFAAGGVRSGGCYYMSLLLALLQTFAFIK